MPSVSKAQRRMAGMAMAAKEGKGKMPMGGGMMGMSLDDLKEYAGTPEKGLLKKVKKGKKR
jgi:hypothetical protein